MSDSSCQILTISSSLDQATSFISRIRSLNATTTQESTSSTTASITPVPSHQVIASPLASMTKIPWTISNRYYTADVHFMAHTMRGLSPHTVSNSPAVIFVWAEGEAYKHHIERLSQGLDGHEPEVSLAVRIRSDNDPADPDEENEDNSAIDEFLSSHGFEYIDAARDLPRASWRTEDEGGYADGIPHLPRVLDALSTIMWPSMRAKTSRKGGALEGSSILSIEERIARDPVVKLLDDMSESQSQSRRKVVRSDETDDELELLREHLVNASLGGASKPMLDLPSQPSIHNVDDLLTIASERLEWWKDGKSGEVVESPGEQNSSTPFGSAWGVRGAERGNVSLRFDDDFADFVSSPPIGIQSAPPELAFDRDSPNSDRSIDTTVGLQSAHAYQYQALRSSSGMGFGDEEGKYEHLDDDDDDELLPSSAEIRATSARIFGGVRSDEAQAEASSQGPREALFSLDALADVMGSDGGAYDMANFDISKVISALQHMKAEIAGMENEDERRKAAAKVALGLVYGLEAEAAEEE